MKPKISKSYRLSICRRTEMGYIAPDLDIIIWLTLFIATDLDIAYG